MKKLRDETKFLDDFQILDQRILVVRKSVNEFFAGEGRTIADLFDLTGEGQRVIKIVPSLFERLTHS